MASSPSLLFVYVKYIVIFSFLMCYTAGFSRASITFIYYHLARVKYIFYFFYFFRAALACPV
jgi:hypothetical protein